MGAVDEPRAAEEIFAGKYRIERVLGMGAMGVVAAAKHLELDELMAIKFMLPSAPTGPRSAERFLREARATARLKSQHVVKVHDMGRMESGDPYIVMEYLEGMDLKQRLCEHGPLPVGDAVLYTIQVCEALAEAHAAGIVHRDLKPANLFLTRAAGGAPCIKVLDFGIAKLTNSTDDEITGTFVSLGTPSYMSPEQLRSARSVDARSDVWSLGVVLYVMLTGRRPFTGEGRSGMCASVAAGYVSRPSRFRPDLPREVEAIVMRCLEKAPARRYQSAADLARALAPFLPVHLHSIDVAGTLHALGGSYRTQDLREAGPATRCQPLKGAAWSVDEVEVDMADPLVSAPQQAHAALAGPAPMQAVGDVTLPSMGSLGRAAVPTRRNLCMRAVHSVLAAIVVGIALLGFAAAREPPGPAPGTFAPAPAPAPGFASAPSPAPERVQPLLHP